MNIWIYEVNYCEYRIDAKDRTQALKYAKTLIEELLRKEEEEKDAGSNR